MKSILVYNKFQHYREAHGYSIEDLAYLCDTTPCTIKLIEDGFHLPCVDLALQLSYILECNLDDLFDLDIEEMMDIDRRKKFLFMENNNEN